MGLKQARTGDTLTEPGAPLVLEAIAAYRPVISLALEPKNTEQGEKLDEALGFFLLEDPTLSLEVDQDTGQRILSGMGELHLEVVLDRLRREYGVDPRGRQAPGGLPGDGLTRGQGRSRVRPRSSARCRTTASWRLSVEPRERDRGRDVVFEFDTSAFRPSS
jgi:elongation factor G